MLSYSLESVGCGSLPDSRKGFMIICMPLTRASYNLDQRNRFVPPTAIRMLPMTGKYQMLERKKIGIYRSSTQCQHFASTPHGIAPHPPRPVREVLMWKSHEKYSDLMSLLLHWISLAIMGSSTQTPWCAGERNKSPWRDKISRGLNTQTVEGENFSKIHREGLPWKPNPSRLCLGPEDKPVGFLLLACVTKPPVELRLESTVPGD